MIYAKRPAAGGQSVEYLSRLASQRGILCSEINEKFRETIMSYSFMSSAAILTLFPFASDSDLRLLVHSVRTRYAAYDIRMWKRLIEHLWSGVVRYTVTDYVQGMQDKVSDMRARRGLGLSALHNTPTRLRK